MTDGLPGHNNNDNWNCMVANNAVNNANSIKRTGNFVYGWCWA